MRMFDLSSMRRAAGEPSAYLMVVALCSNMLLGCDYDVETPVHDAAMTASEDDEGGDSSSGEQIASTGFESSSTGDMGGDAEGRPDFSSGCFVEQSVNVGTSLVRVGSEATNECSTVLAPTLGCDIDIAGSWSYVRECYPEELLSPREFECPGSVIDPEPKQMSGTLELLEGGILYREVQQSGMMFTLPDVTCFGVESCDELSILFSPDGECTEVEGACSCSFGFTQSWVGTWEFAEGVLKLAFSDGTSAEYTACAAGETLDLWSSDVFSAATGVPCKDVDDCVEALGEPSGDYGYTCLVDS